MVNDLDLIYISNERFPAKIACTIQQMIMCEAFGKSGANVTLLYPKYGDMSPVSSHDLQSFYNVSQVFKIQTIPSLLHLSKPLVDGRKKLTIPYIGGMSLLLSMWYYALKNLIAGQFNTNTIAYSRNVNAAVVFLSLKEKYASKKPIRIIFEVHSLDQQHPKKFFYRILKQADGLVCISEALKKKMIERYNVDPEKIVVAHDGVRKNLLEQKQVSKKEARGKMGLADKKIILYTGQILPGKGAEVFVDAAKYFPDDYLFLLVGGHGEFLQRMKNKVNSEKISNIQLSGFVPVKEIPLYLSCADVLVLPATAGHDISDYTSPLKMFEYMAAQRPIIASDLPVLKEILNENNAIFFKQSDSQDLANKISTLMNNQKAGEKLSHQAFADVQNFTWEKRAENILKFIRTKFNTL